MMTTLMPQSAERDRLALVPIDDLASLAEVAELLNVPKRTAARYVERDDFPAPIAALAVGRIWRASAVEQWGRDRLPLPRGRALGPQVISFRLETPDGVRFISVGREPAARLIEHLRATGAEAAASAAEKIIAESQLYTGGNDISLTARERRAVTLAAQQTIAEGWGLNALHRLTRDL